jgi:predicted nucleic acid-binding protein
MTPKNLRVFLDTSVIFAAVLSKTGGARKLFHLGEAGVLHLIVGLTVLREADEVVRRKIPASLPTLAQLLSIGLVETSPISTKKQLELARAYVQYPPDARVLADAIQANPDWFVTHDKEHFLHLQYETDLSFRIGTPGDLLQSIKGDFVALELE